MTGRSKDSISKWYGAEQFLSWRRSVDDTPPAMTREAAMRLYRGRHDGITEQHLGRTESLGNVVSRVTCCWLEVLQPVLNDAKVVAVIAHGNSLRALCTLLDELTDAEVRALNLPTGQPLVYRIDTHGRSAVRGGSYLDPRAATEAAALIAQEGGT